MTEHIRHSPGPRNIHKMQHHLNCAVEEGETLRQLLASIERRIASLSGFLHPLDERAFGEQMTKAADSARYIRGRLARIDNRLKSEAREALGK
jgi:hypothetical protein